MISEKEVRIGNLVAAGVVPVTIVGIHTYDILEHKKKAHFYVDGFVGANYCFGPNDLEGIPLAEEWFGKLGFEYDLHTHSRGNIWLAITSTGRYDVFLAGLYNGSQTTIEFVHELQNLYYALIGTELLH